MLDGLLSAIAPHLCCSCGDISSILCDSCKYDISYDRLFICIECGVYNPSGICNRHEVAYSKAWCIGERKQALERLINQLKFQRVRAASTSASGLLDTCVPQLPTTTVVTSIPTAPSHVRARGYDHALLIAKTFARSRSLHFETLLTRSHNLSQKDANRKERQEQAKTAFYAPLKLDPTVPYLVVDDIVTTGATLRFATEALAAAGARTIWVAVIARQPLD